MECECGLMSNIGEKYCPNCNLPIRKDSLDKKLGILELHVKYDIPVDDLKLVSDLLFLDHVKDNCIIYADGIVDAFDNPDELLKHLEDGLGLAETHEDIAHVIIDGKKVDFSIVNNVCIFKPDEIEGPKVNVEDHVDSATLNSSDYIILANDAKGSVMKFDSAKQMAEYIDITAGEDVAMIFIKKEYHDWQITKYLKIKDMSIEIEPLTPFN